MYKKITLITTKIFLLSGIWASVSAVEGDNKEVKVAPLSLSEKVVFKDFASSKSLEKWTDANLSTTPSIHIKRPKDLTNEDFENHSLIVKIRDSYLPKEDSLIKCKVFLNNTHVKDIEFSQAHQPKRIQIPLGLLEDRNQDQFCIRFEIEGSSSPKDYGLEDPRSLAFSIQALKLLNKKMSLAQKFSSGPSTTDLFLSGYPLSFENFDAILKKYNVQKIVASVTAPRSGTVFLNSILQNFDGFHDMVHGNSEKSFLHKEKGSREKMLKALETVNYNFEAFMDQLIGNNVKNGIFSMVSHHRQFASFLEMFDPKCLSDSRWLLLLQDRRNVVASNLSQLHAFKSRVGHNWSDQETHLKEISQEEYDQIANKKSSQSKKQFTQIADYFPKESCLAFAYEDLVTDPFSIIKIILEEAGRSNVSVSEIEEAIGKSVKRNKSNNRNEQMAGLLSQKDKREAFIQRLKEPLISGL